MNSAEESAVGNLLPFGRETVALILRDCVARALNLEAGQSIPRGPGVESRSRPVNFP
jgi:hypothetical protein